MKLTRLSWEHIAEAAWQLTVRPGLRDAAAIARFDTLAPRYEEFYGRLACSGKGSAADGSPFDWSDWACTVRKSFAGGVPRGFLAHPILSRTLVFARRHGVSAAAQRIALVEAAYGEQVAKRLLLEDPIGLPTIASRRMRTSANRAHHASHLAMYRLTRGQDFWDAGTIVEWGGGYGDMARILRRINPSATYVIIDLPEMLALQYVYLGAVEGESVLHIVDPAAPLFPAGKISLVNASDVAAIIDALRANAFLSTWAITESPVEAQTFVADHHYFGASRLLLATARHPNNALAPRFERDSDVRRVDVPFFNSGVMDDYWFR
jgi:hypothetical protein